MKKLLNVAIVGATGAVGRELLKILKERNFPVGELRLFASARSESATFQVLKKGCFDGIEIAFFDASDEVSKDWVVHAAEAGAWVIDNSATFRMDADVPLSVPEVNGRELEVYLDKVSSNPRSRIIAGPNCTTVQLVMALHPLKEVFGLKRVVVSTYQATSGAGTLAMDELRNQTQAVLNQSAPVEPKVFPHSMAFNCIPQIGSFSKAPTELTEGYTSEELKVIAETRKILGLPGLKITATAVRVPTLSCHSESVNVECDRPASVQAVKIALKAQSGVIVLDEPLKCDYPMNSHATGKDAVYVGRIRKDFSTDNGIHLWVVSDNLRKGAALNAVQIAEKILTHLR